MYYSFPSHTIFVGVYVFDLGRIGKKQHFNLFKTDLLPVTFCALKPIKEASGILSFKLSMFSTSISLLLVCALY